LGELNEEDEGEGTKMAQRSSHIFRMQLDRSWFLLNYNKAMNFWFGPIQVAALILLLLFRHTQDFKRRIEYGI
jgi:hypothetical protein